MSTCRDVHHEQEDKNSRYLSALRHDLKRPRANKRQTAKQGRVLPTDIEAYQEDEARQREVREQVMDEAHDFSPLTADAVQERDAAPEHADDDGYSHDQEDSPQADAKDAGGKRHSEPPILQRFPR